jgi:hypothetical protein
MGLFSSTRACDSCGAEVPKGELHGFDPGMRGERRGTPPKTRLCRACLAGALGDALRAFPYRALVVEPSPEGNGYSFAPLDIPTRSFDWGSGQEAEELKGSIRALLPPPGSACIRCGRPASFTWCGLEAFVDPFELRLQWHGQSSEQFLCNACVASDVEERIRASAVIFDEVIPPADGDGVLTSAEC